MPIIKYFLFISYIARIKILVIKDFSGSFSVGYSNNFRFRKSFGKGFQFLQCLFALSTTSFISY